MKVALFEKKHTNNFKTRTIPCASNKECNFETHKKRKASTLISTQKKYYHEQEQEHLRKTGN